MSTTAVETKVKNQEQLGGLYLTFRMGDENYGIEILKVQEIMQMMMVTPIPRTPSFIKGIINLRGKVIPVIDLRTKFNLTSVNTSEQNCIIVVDLGEIHMGVIIDAVSDVMNFPEDKIDRVPSFGVTLNTEFIRGIGKVNETVTILLDIQEVLTSDERECLNTIVAAKQDAKKPAETDKSGSVTAKVVVAEKTPV